MTYAAGEVKVAMATRQGTGMQRDGVLRGGDIMRPSLQAVGNHVGRHDCMLIKENLPHGGGSWVQQQPKKGGQELRKDRAVLSDIGNIGGMGALELLKERVKKLKDEKSRPARGAPIAKGEVASTTKSSQNWEIWSQPGPGGASLEVTHKSEVVSRWTSMQNNMEVTAVDLLSSKMTGSSSGSSATPSLTGVSPVYEDKVKYHQSVQPESPSAGQGIPPNGMNNFDSRSMHARRLKRLGPACRVPPSGPAMRVLRATADAKTTQSSSSGAVEAQSSRISGTTPENIASENEHAVTPEEVEKYGGKLEYDYHWSDQKKRKAEVSGAMKERDSHFKRMTAPKNVESDRVCTSSPMMVSPGRVPSVAIQQSRSAPLEQHYNCPGASQTPKRSAHRIDSNLIAGMREFEAKVRSDRVSGSSGSDATSTSRSQARYSPSVDELSDESKERRRRSARVLTVAKEERGLAVDMSHDGADSADNNENTGPSIHHLSSSLGALSMGAEDVPKKAQPRVPLQNCVNNSLLSSAAPANHLSNIKSLEQHNAPPLTTSHSGITTEDYIHDQGRNSLPAEHPKRQESAERKPPTPPFPSERPSGRRANAGVGLESKENRSLADVRTVPSERAENLGANAEHHPSLETSKDNGNEQANATSQKISENAHFVWVKDKRYQKLGKIGKGGSSEVYKVIDSDCNIFAMKKINLKGRDHGAALGFYQEIEYLERLRGKRNVVQLIGYEVTNRAVIREDYEADKISEDACIYVVLEFGEIDLAGILSKKRKEMLESNELIDDNWLRFYWKHMLLAVKTIHDERIVHADLKPANFLLVKGELKLIDFGIAKAIQNDTTHIVRDTQVGTLNYMSPEAFMTNSKDEHGQTVKCGRASDIWSLGCILYQMVYGHTPFSHVTSFYAKIQAITSKNYKIEFPPIPDPCLLDVMKKCLTWDRHSRPHINDLLQHPFLRPDLARQRNSPC